MPNSDVGQAILDEIKRLGERFGRVEDRVSSLDGRMGSLESRMTSFESRMTSLESRMTSLEAVVADLDGRVKSWPDMHYLAAAAKAQLSHTREMKTDVADIKVKMDEIYQSMATNPEVQNLRDEVAHFRDQSVTIDVRLGAIEGRLGVEDNPQPR